MLLSLAFTAICAAAPLRATAQEPASQEPSLREARGLLESARTAGDAGDPARARAEAAKAIETLLAVDPLAADIALANLLTDAAELAHSAGEIRAAHAGRERALDVMQRVLPPDHRDLQGARSNLAVSKSALGDLRGARELLERALEILERTLADDDDYLLRTRQNLGATLHSLGELDAARELKERVLATRLAQYPPEHEAVLRAQSNLAITMHVQGDVAGARALFEKVLDARTRTLPDDHADLQQARNNMAASLNASGQIDAARALHEKVLAIRTRTLPEDHADLQMARGNLATTLGRLGDHARARVLEEQVLAARTRTLPDDHPTLQLARVNLAATLRVVGRLADARALLEKVVAVQAATRPEDDPDAQRARLTLAAVLLALDERELARELQESVLAIRTNALPETHEDLQRARTSLAIGLIDSGDCERAIELLEKALAAREPRLPAGNGDLQLTRSTLAVAIAQRCAALAADDPRRGELEKRFRDVARAHARDVQRAAINDLLDGSSREAEERAASRAHTLDRALSNASGMGVFERDAELEVLAFTASESLRGMALGSALLARAARADAESAKLVLEFKTARDELVLAARNGIEGDAFVGARARADAAERELVHRGAALAGAGASLAPSLDAYAARLGERDALIAFRVYQRGALAAPPQREHVLTPSLCAFVVRSGARLERVELGPLAPIESAVELWRDALRARRERGVAAEELADADTIATARGAELHALVIAPLAAALAEVDRAIVALDGTLHSVPFDALPAGDGMLLGDKLRIQLRSSLFEFAVGARASSDAGTLVALGSPAFDDEPVAVEASTSPDAAEPTAHELERGAGWERAFVTLPETCAEVRGIAAYFADVFGDARESVVLERARASRDALLELAPRARYLHVATHGWFAPDSLRSLGDPTPLDPAAASLAASSGEERVRGMSPMLLCGLALAGANLPPAASGELRGVITAEEIATLDLANCELAVLSACDTNVGVRRAGQGVASLQKALHMAGARAVITSLWKVPDEATKELMLDFYRRLWVEKKPASVALWEAKAKLRNARDEHGAPLYSTRDWAAWVLTGDAR